ncbi:hypothetical protein T459_11194 [Capsicum annuum]|uniref:Uncharacterized protein n=1 Tax=Capsicum annuum TaxID=4072 RepID=A0A2G2ZLE5_CAPAN|nr:hypothetical protein T459_11194 [Capsicum annuum]
MTLVTSMSYASDSIPLQDFCVAINDPNNSHGGTVPPSLSNSTSLTVSLANGCSIQVSIPSSITKLKKLRILMLNDNNIAGQLPVSMSSLTSLQYLSKFQNGLRGYIPTPMCQILSQEYLNKEWNELTGRLPSCILQLPKISYLSVQKNNLNGNMPLSLFQKSRLDQISFGVGGLSVEIDDRDQSFVQTFQTSPYYKIQELNLAYWDCMYRRLHHNLYQERSDMFQHDSFKKQTAWYGWEKVSDSGDLKSDNKHSESLGHQVSGDLKSDLITH